MKFEGMFSLRGVAKEGRAPEEVEQALYAEIERLRTELVDPRELQKVKNQKRRVELPPAPVQLHVDEPAARPRGLARLGND